MAIYKYLARNHNFDISVDNSTWVPISGINSWDWSEDSKDADISDFDSAGWNSSFSTSRGAKLKIEGFYLLDEASGARDSGQIMSEVAARKFGSRGFRYMRVVARDTDDLVNIGSITVQASLKLGGSLGGGQDDVQKFMIEATVQGRPTGSGVYAIF